MNEWAAVIGLLTTAVGFFIWGVEVGESRERRSWFDHGATWDPNGRPEPAQSMATTSMLTPVFVWPSDPSEPMVMGHAFGGVTSATPGVVTPQRKVSMPNIEGLTPVPERLGWYLGSLNYVTDPEVGQQTDVALVHESGRTLVLQLAGRVEVAEAVGPAQAKISEWEQLT